MQIDIALQELQVRLEYLGRIIDKTDKYLMNSPPGRLRIQRQGNSVAYYCAAERPGNKDHNGRLIDKSEQKLVQALAYKNYLMKVKKFAESEYRAIKHLIDHYPDSRIENIYSGLRDDRKRLINPVALSDEEYAEQWMDKPYKKKAFKEGAPEFYTLKGERVRSKSEQIIADRLNYYHIPYKYECPIMVCGEVYHPDFTILRMRDRKVLYWEHCGMMDKEDYANYAVNRFNKYAKEGIILGKDLFATFETGKYPMNTEAVDKLINAHFK